MNEKEHLPIYGVGPFCVISMLLIFLIGVFLHLAGYLDSGRIKNFQILFIILGGALILVAVWIWINAVLIQKIDQEIKKNHLVTTGIYAWVRNPIYSAIAIALTGLGMFFANAWLLFLPCLFWVEITVLMKFTEEKWLKERYGQSYMNYCKRVNRCIPWIPKQK